PPASPRSQRTRSSSKKRDTPPPRPPRRRPSSRRSRSPSWGSHPGRPTRTERARRPPLRRRNRAESRTHGLIHRTKEEQRLGFAPFFRASAPPFPLWWYEIPQKGIKSPSKPMPILLSTAGN